MFCKWCGGNLTPSDTKCKRCGKDIPALSDCGGFYDLIPNERKPVEAHTIANVFPAETELDRCDESEKNELTQKKNDKKALVDRFIAAGTGFAAIFMIALLLLINNNANKQFEAIAELQNSLSEIAFDIEAIEGELKSVEKISQENINQTDAEPEETIDSAVEEDDLDANTQDVCVAMVVVKNENGKEYITDIDLGEYLNGASLSYSYISDAHTDESVSVICGGKGAEEAVKLGYLHKTEDDFQCISVVYEVEEAVFGPLEVPETCKWQYRTSVEDDWKDIPEDYFVQTDTSGKSELSMAESVRYSLLEDNESILELRCEIYRTNTDGSSLTLVIEGMDFSEGTVG